MSKEKIKIEKISDIIALFNGVRTYAEVGAMLDPTRSGSTVARWVTMLRKEGFKVDTASKGKRKLIIE